MKTHRLLFLLYLAGYSCLQAQPYQITFTGSGLSSTVATVVVQNLTQGTTLTLAGTDILELVTTIGISDHFITKGEILIYPNPSESTCRMEFFNKQPGDVRIELFDATGKLLLRKDEYLLEGNHSYRLGGLKSGVYFLKVSTPAGSYSERVISTGNAQGVPVLEYIGITQKMLHQPKLTSPAGIIQMQYNAGEMLLFKGFSFQGFSPVVRVITLLPTQSQSVDFLFVACSDGDSNHYPVVTIGTQTWMAENLKTTKYSNSAAIPLVTYNSAWAGLSTGARCWINNDSATYANTYGALYNWYAVDNTNALCPTGWHVPTDLEWQTLEMHLGMTQSQANSTGWRGTDEGGKMKEAGLLHWRSPNTGATNSSGFTALPGGYRSNDLGNFGDVGYYGNWWSSTAYSTATAWYRTLGDNGSNVYRGSANKNYGLSVRCVRDY
jgi:uncharacterized protein (TIGR02145 family)